MDIIDCDVLPMIPNGWKVEEHREGGRLAFDASKAGLYLSERQTEGEKWIVGHELNEELRSKPVLNANVLDHFLLHRECMPDAWLDKGMVFFWGTIYRISDGRLCVRYVQIKDGRLNSGRYCLDDLFGPQFPAAVLVEGT